MNDDIQKQHDKILDGALELLADNVNKRLEAAGADVRVKPGWNVPDEMSFAVTPTGQLVQLHPQVAPTPAPKIALTRREAFEHALDYIVQQSGTKLENLHQSIRDLATWGRWAFAALESNERTLKRFGIDDGRLKRRVDELERLVAGLRWRNARLMKQVRR